VLARPDGDPARADTVQPGCHQFGSGDGEYDVVWWDPGVLTLDVTGSPGVRHETLIGKEAPRAVVDETRAAFDAWHQARTSAVAQASQPSVTVMTVSEWAALQTPLPGGVELPPVSVAVVDGRDSHGRPAGTAFGTLVHAVLSGVALDAPRSDVAAVTASAARLLGTEPADADAAAELVTRVLETPLLRRAARSPRCRREVPVTMSGPDATLVEGVADLIFEENGGSVVVEFKTDVEIGKQGLERYRRQVGFYVAAVHLTTGRAAEGILLRI
jgi:ATP-dependent exoDNAse (exonuclease V) beta subunit